MPIASMVVPLPIRIGREVLSIRMLSTSRPILIGNGTTIEAIGIGTIKLRTSAECYPQLNDILLAPAIKHNLISIIKFENNYKAMFMNTVCIIYDPNGQE